MTTLPVREMVLYKHGVGFFVREGEISGESVALTFRQDEINDVLKSLAVFDKAGGQVLGIHYQTPMDKAARLASSSIRLSDHASLGDLLSGLRGRLVTVEVQSDQSNYFTGRMLGIDDFTEEQDYVRSRGRRVSLLIQDKGVVTFDWLAIRSLQIVDTQADHDLTYFLDTSLSEDNRRTVNVRLSPGEHQLAVYYVAPSPTWRVSYRLVAESDENGETGKALLQGWGLFDNRLEEDLDNVRVTLVAGQPISFIYDLYESRIPQRPTVKDEARIAPGPVEYAGVSEPLEYFEDESGGILKSPAAFSAPIVSTKARSNVLYRAVGAAQTAQSTPPVAQAKEAGEFFQYIVTAPVSVKRGESSLVPIIGSEIKYQRELLYNRAKLPDHPVVALRFSNTTGLTLERGPVTVVEDSDYKGEAVIAFTKDNHEVYVPFAVELGVQVTEHVHRDHQTIGMSIANLFLVYEQYLVGVTKYVIENTTSRQQAIVIEASIKGDWQMFDTRPADIETATERRWRVNLQPHSKTEFVQQERQRIYHREEIRRLDYQKLQEIIKNRWLTDAIRQELSTMLDELSRIDKAKNSQVKLNAEREGLYKQQEQLRANLGALQPTGQEAALRKRMLDQLEASQDRLEAIEKEINDLAAQIAQAEANVNQIIASLG